MALKVFVGIVQVLGLGLLVVGLIAGAWLLYSKEGSKLTALANAMATISGVLSLVASLKHPTSVWWLHHIPCWMHKMFIWLGLYEAQPPPSTSVVPGDIVVVSTMVVATAEEAHQQVHAAEGNAEIAEVTPLLTTEGE